jgi:hypothetical protein
VSTRTTKAQALGLGCFLFADETTVIRALPGHWPLPFPCNIVVYVAQGWSLYRPDQGTGWLSIAVWWWLQSLLQVQPVLMHGSATSMAKTSE